MTGVQTCALPISAENEDLAEQARQDEEERRQAGIFAKGVENEYWQEKAGIGPGEQQDLFPRDLYLAQNIPQIRGTEPSDVYRESYDVGPAQPGRTVTPVITAERLVEAGIDPGKNQWAYKNLLGKDLSVQSDWDSVQGTVNKIRGNKRIAESTKSGVENLIKGLMPYAEQQRIERSGTPRIQGLAPVSRTPGEASGVSTGLPSGQKPSVPTAGVGVSETGAVAPVTPVAPVAPTELTSVQ